MNTPHLAPRLAEYHRLARELAQESARLHGVPEEMRALHDEHAAARAALDELAARADGALRERVAREGEVADAQERLRKFQQQVSRVRNQREYGALLGEIDGAKAALRGLEDGVLELLERAEAAKRELAERESAFGELAERHAAGLAAWEAKKPAVAARVAELEAAVAALRAELPKGIVSQYGRLAERYQGEALATLARTERAGGTVLWHCSACNYHVRPQAALEIRSRGVLSQCDGCRRFLVADEQDA
jgi:predicted  nucleic acid-binding Zn-ribbon protein